MPDSCWVSHYRSTVTTLHLSFLSSTPMTIEFPQPSFRLSCPHGLYSSAVSATSLGSTPSAPDRFPNSCRALPSACQTRCHGGARAVGARERKEEDERDHQTEGFLD